MGIFSGITNQETEEVFSGVMSGKSAANSETDIETGGEGNSDPQPNSNAPNVIFVGRREVLNKTTGMRELVAIEAPLHISDADTFIELPLDEIQKTGFYSEHANVLVSLFPTDYKTIKNLGE